MDKILFYMPTFKKMADLLSNEVDIKIRKYELKRFLNGEEQIDVDADIKNKECIVLGSISPPDEQTLEFFLLCQTLKKEGAKKITALLPYMAYMRQDEDEPLKSWGAKWVAKLAETSGIDKIMTFDIHSRQAFKLFKIPLVSLSPAEMFADEIKKIGFLDATIVAPDKGAIERAEKIKSALGKKEPIAYFEKKRIGDKVSSSLHSKVGTKAIITDDQLDTGGTLIAASDILNNHGAKEIIVMVTHGLFTGEKWKKLFDLNVKKIYTTDSIPSVQKQSSDKIRILAIIPVIKKYLEKQ